MVPNMIPWYQHNGVHVVVIVIVVGSWSVRLSVNDRRFNSQISIHHDSDLLLYGKFDLWPFLMLV